MYRLKCEENQLSWGQRFLLDYIDKRKLTEFARENLVQNHSLTYSFHIAVGDIEIPSLTYMYSLAYFIHPIFWFTKLSEPKPELKPLKKVISIRESQNYKIIEEMFKKGDLFTFCRENNLPYVKIYHVVHGRSNISVRQIGNLREFFPIENWFE